MNIFSFFKRSRVKSDLPPLKFFNTLSGTLEAFEPLNHTVKMYNCGPTVYDYAHIGNLRSYIFADTIRRALTVWGYRVKQVINITDFGHLTSDADEGDDKMTQGLKREGLALTLKNMKVLAERYTAAFLQNLTELGVDIKKIEFPNASDYIAEEIALVKTLEQKGYTYTLKDGVYFDTAKFPTYGKLGNINLAGQQAGTRLEQNTEKKNPADFVLWKSDAKLGWKSPWGLGFPGWHIECTAMIFTLLGRQIDVHTGGVDHIAIHHNNEIAQAEAVTRKQFVKYWMHGEFITVEDKRVGKSMGNAILLQGLIDKGYSARSLRYWFLTGHYRTPMNFTWDAIEGANTALTKLRRGFLELTDARLESRDTLPEATRRVREGGEEGATANSQKDFLKHFYSAIAEDLNTAKAIALIWDMLKDPTTSAADKRAFLIEADKVLGLGITDKGPEAKIKVVERADLPTDVEKLLNEREEARTTKDFTKADELRAKIEEAGYTLTDGPEGAKITKK